MTEPPVAPDDTPTRQPSRLEDIQARDDRFMELSAVSFARPLTTTEKAESLELIHALAVDSTWLLAEVSRLREALEKTKTPGLIGSLVDDVEKWLARAEAAEAEVSQLRKELQAMTKDRDAVSKMLQDHTEGAGAADE